MELFQSTVIELASLATSLAASLAISLGSFPISLATPLLASVLRRSALRRERDNRKLLPSGKAFLKLYVLSNGTGEPLMSSIPVSAGIEPSEIVVSAGDNHSLCICIQQDVSTEASQGTIGRSETIWRQLEKSPQSDRERLRTTFAHGSTSSHASTRGFSALREQWVAKQPDGTWDSSSFLIGTQPPTGKMLRPGTSQGNNERFDSEGEKPPDFAGVGGSEILGNVLIRATRQIRIVEDDESDRLLVTVTCLSEQNSKGTTLNDGSTAVVIASLHHYDEKLVESCERNKSLLCDSTSSRSDIRRILLLCHSQAQLHAWTKCIATIRRCYTDSRRALLDSRNLAMRPHLMEEVANDAYIYKELAANAGQYLVTIESLLHSTSESFASGETSQQQQLKELIADIRGECSDLRFRTDEMNNDLGHHLKFLELKRGVRESSSLWVLSVLASIFLPLSLASSILSMGTRFVDLGPLLYDFCGVVVLLMTLVGIVVITLTFSSWAQEKMADESRNRYERTFFVLIVALSIITFWGLLLSSFIVGMVHDTSLGGQILGYGAAGLVALLLLAMPFMWLIFRFLQWFSPRFRVGRSSTGLLNTSV